MNYLIIYTCLRFSIPAIIICLLLIVNYYKKTIPVYIFTFTYIPEYFFLTMRFEVMKRRI